MVYNRKGFTWNKKEKELSYLGEVIITMEKHPEHKGLYYLRWNNGDRSDDFYNLSRAVEHGINYTLSELNKTGV